MHYAPLVGLSRVLCSINDRLGAIGEVMGARRAGERLDPDDGRWVEDVMGVLEQRARDAEEVNTWP